MQPLCLYRKITDLLLFYAYQSVIMLTGKNLIGNEAVASGNETFLGVNPTTNHTLATEFHDATLEEIDKAADLAEEAFQRYRRYTPTEKALFLDQIANEIEALGDTLLQRCHEETALPLGRLEGERGRTCNQLRLFANLVREGSWVDARIDVGDPHRSPLPKPDLRSMQIPLGPVAVFGASNFPLAFSVAGGDTASALAAGCPVIVKAHPAHPGTSELVGKAIVKAAIATNMPLGIFALVHGRSNLVGEALVKHPKIKAVGFTGSFRGGKALFDIAVQRPEPIPVYAEMGSVNPVFILPGAMRESHAEIAKGLATSVTLGVGQFCTNPGIVVAMEEAATGAFFQQLESSMQTTPTGSMLTGGIRQAYGQGIERLKEEGNVAIRVKTSPATYVPNQPESYIFTTKASTALESKGVLFEEVFGPSTIVITADTVKEVYELARKMDGQLTATIHGTAADLEEHKELIYLLERKVGRLVFNSFPTGVEVSHAMVHGGPYPATTAPASTSVGTKAIERFVRPVCYQGFPQAALPDELKDANPFRIWRLVDGKWTNGEIA